MLNIMIPEYEDIPLCAQVYVRAYSVMPWNESYELPEVIEYITSYTASDTKCCFALQENNKSGYNLIGKGWIS